MDLTNDILSEEDRQKIEQNSKQVLEILEKDSNLEKTLRTKPISITQNGYNSMIFLHQGTGDQYVCDNKKENSIDQECLLKTINDLKIAIKSKDSEISSLKEELSKHKTNKRNNSLNQYN